MLEFDKPSMDQVADALNVLERAGICNWDESMPSDIGSTFYVEFVARKVDIYFDENDEPNGWGEP